MPTRKVTFTEHYENFVEDGITSGRFSDVNQIVQEGLRLLEERHSEDAKLEWLRTTTEEAFAALDRGEGISFSSAEDTDSLVNDVMNNLHLLPSKMRD